MAWLGIIIILYLHGYARSRNLSCLDPVYSYLLIPEERRKTFDLSIESNPGPLASQATALTTGPSGKAPALMALNENTFLKNTDYE